MEDQTTHNKSKVPILGDIPLLGWLFKSQTSRSLKNNLLIFITPYVLRDPTDFNEISSYKIEQRNRFIEQNYGKKQQKAIFDTISQHRADLLSAAPYQQNQGVSEKNESSSSANDMLFPPVRSQPSSSPAKGEPAASTSTAQPASPSSSQLASAPSSGGPVITVPSVNSAGASTSGSKGSQSKGAGSVDRAY